MKLIKTILKLIEESEKEYNQAIEKGLDEKTMQKIEKKYEDSVKLMEMYNRMNNLKKNVD
jgi:hypothetical protein